MLQLKTVWALDKIMMSIPDDLQVGQVIQDTCTKDMGQQEFRSIQESDKKGEKDNL